MALDKSIHELDESLLLDDQLEIPFSQDNGGTWTTFKAKLTALALKIIKTITYTDLTTSSKTVVGAINELKAGQSGGYTDVTGTLTAGQTSITLSDASITSSSTIDIYTDVFGIQPTNAVVASGSITLTFLAQASDITVKVRVS